MKQHFKKNHPAHHDQQVALAHDLIPKANAWILFANVPEGDDTNKIHGMISMTPGADPAGFLRAALEMLQGMVIDLIKVVNDDDFDEAGEET